MESGITDTTAGVTLNKYYEDDEYDLPSVVYEFASERPEAVEISLEEAIPSELDPQHVGFHANYGTEYWRVQDGTLQFEHVLEPETEYTTVIGINPDAEYDAERLVTTPETFEIEALESPPVGSPPPGSFTRSASTDEATTGGGTASTPVIEIGDDRTTTEADHGTDGPDASAAELSDTGEPEDGGTDSVADGDSIGAELAAELDAETLSDDALETLRRRLQPEQAVPGSVDARIDQLQSDVSELTAYTSALEEFLDEHGSARELIERFEDELESFEDGLESVESRTDEHDHEIASLRADVEEREREHESLSGELSSVLDDVDDLSSEVSQLRSEVPDDVEERLATVEDDVSEVSDIIKRLNEAFA